MFLPMGFFLTLALGTKRAWVAAIAMPLTTGAIELSQLLFLPSRYATWSDILANSVGGWIGVAFCSLILWASGGFQARRRSS